ncbi:hypothetical protein ACQR1W_38225 [Bradyrhizobium sp. HKCCYLS1011]|uniref:hypothetical protein n=1 Tax=Bradyrhizobium sp. HKCCYLS1011 TaxID=3420733 RepID=UPI003EBE7046
MKSLIGSSFILVMAAFASFVPAAFTDFRKCMAALYVPACTSSLVNTNASTELWGFSRDDPSEAPENRPAAPSGISDGSGDAPPLARRIRQPDGIELTILLWLVVWLRAISACRMHHMGGLGMIFQRTTARKVIGMVSEPPRHSVNDAEIQRPRPFAAADRRAALVEEAALSGRW